MDVKCSINCYHFQFLMLGLRFHFAMSYKNEDAQNVILFDSCVSIRRTIEVSLLRGYNVLNAVTDAMSRKERDDGN